MQRRFLYITYLNIFYFLSRAQADQEIEALALFISLSLIFPKLYKVISNFLHSLNWNVNSRWKSLIHVSSIVITRHKNLESVSARLQCPDVSAFVQQSNTDGSIVQKFFSRLNHFQWNPCFFKKLLTCCMTIFFKSICHRFHTLYIYLCFHHSWSWIFVYVHTTTTKTISPTRNCTRVHFT